MDGTMFWGLVINEEFGLHSNHRECASCSRREITGHIWCKYFWYVPYKSGFTSVNSVFMDLEATTLCCKHFSSLFSMFPEKLFGPVVVPLRLGDRWRTGHSFTCIKPTNHCEGRLKCSKEPIFKSCIYSDTITSNATHVSRLMSKNSNILFPIDIAFPN